ncbi:MAG TPA: YlbF family regulator [Bellilinea sp.]|nr:YlbF family regulator [Bellilinea sp.]
MKMTEHILPKPLLGSAERLASSLLEAEPISAYHQAKERLESDEEAQTLLTEFINAQNDFRTKQPQGEVTQADIDALRALDQRVRANQIIAEYAASQRVATTYLAYVNGKISRLLGVDFTTLASSGCC